MPNITVNLPQDDYAIAMSPESLKESVNQ